MNQKLREELELALARARAAEVSCEELKRALQQRQEDSDVHEEPSRKKSFRPELATHIRIIHFATQT